jgi:hypothetical protein
MESLLENEDMKTLIAISLLTTTTGPLAAATNAVKKAITPEELYYSTLAVLVGSFALAMAVGLFELTSRRGEQRREPGIDAYRDQMAAANGAFLRRE